MPLVLGYYKGDPWNVNGTLEPQDGTYSTHFIRDHALDFLDTRLRTLTRTPGWCTWHRSRPICLLLI